MKKDGPSGDEQLYPEVEETRPCPHCGEPVSRGATVCLHCEEEIASLMSFGEFARRFGSPHSGGPPPPNTGGATEVRPTSSEDGEN